MNAQEQAGRDLLAQGAERARVLREVSVETIPAHARRGRDDDALGFARGLVLAVPVGLLMWAALIAAGVLLFGAGS